MNNCGFKFSVACEWCVLIEEDKGNSLEFAKIFLTKFLKLLICQSFFCHRFVLYSTYCILNVLLQILLPSRELKGKLKQEVEDPYQVCVSMFVVCAYVCICMLCVYMYVYVCCVCVCVYVLRKCILCSCAFVRSFKNIEYICSHKVIICKAKLYLLTDGHCCGIRT